MAYLQLAQVQTSARDFFEYFNKARSLVDEVSEGEKLRILGFEAGAVNGDPMRARKYLQQLTRMYSDDERARNLLATSYFAQQQWTEAVAEYKRAIKINPEFSQPYNQLGYAYRFLEKYDQAEDAFKKYVELIPNDPNPYDSYAELLMKMGRFDESIEKYRQALEVSPDFIFSRLGRFGRCLPYESIGQRVVDVVVSRLLETLFGPHFVPLTQVGFPKPVEVVRIQQAGLAQLGNGRVKVLRLERDLPAN